jgi:Exostosin family
MKIMVQSCDHSPDASTRQQDLLRELFASSVQKLHQWTENPAEAEVIFLTNAQQQWGALLEKHPLPRRFPEKCFALSEQWEPPFLLAGIYANAPRSALWRGRFRSGSYALHHPDFRNTFIESYNYGQESAQRSPDLLASFLGRNCHPIREHLLAMNFPKDKILIEDTSSFNAFTLGREGKLGQQQHYFEICLRSKFILCPRGAGPNSIRLFEALKMGIAPVIISDAWVRCEGPRWDDFALFIAEKDIDTVESAMEHIESEYQQRGKLARQAYEEFFSPQVYFNYLVNAAVSARQSRIIPERLFVSLWPVQRLLRKARQRGRWLVGAKQK